jgi:hypothetical protein
MVPLAAMALRFLEPQMQPTPDLPPEFLRPVRILAYLTKFSPAGPIQEKMMKASEGELRGKKPTHIATSHTVRER